MSFYGNSYFYTADTFARVILQNAGIDISTVPNLAEIIKDKVYLDSHKRDAGLGISSGNRWIALKQMTGADQGFEIWHNAPRSTGDGLIMVVPEAQDVNPNTSDEVQETDSKYVENAIHLGFGDCIKIPTFYYDEAGHVSSKNQMVYFQLPENPMDDATDRMNAIEDRMDLIDGDDPSSLKSQLKKGISDLNAATANIEKAVKDSGDALRLAEAADSNASNAFNKAKEAIETANAASGSYTRLDARVAALEAKI